MYLNVYTSGLKRFRSSGGSPALGQPVSIRLHDTARANIRRMVQSRTKISGPRILMLPREAGSAVRKTAFFGLSKADGPVSVNYH